LSPITEIGQPAECQSNLTDRLELHFLESTSMAEQPVVVQKISWSDLCPWTLIFKTLPVAASVSVLVFGLLGVVLSPMGWLLSETIFINEDLLKEKTGLMPIVEVNRSPYRGVFLATETNADTIEVFGAPLSGPRMVFRQYVRPFEHLFSSNWGLREFLYFLVGCCWSIFVWSFVGLAIARICLLRLTRNEQSGIDDAFEFAVDKWLTTAGAIGIPLAAVALLCIPGFVIGLLMGFDLGVVIAGVLWFAVLACALVMGLLLFGLMFGWPLMVASVGCEGQNSFDAMTRAYAYTFQRPLHYAFYMVIAILFGGFCWLIVSNLTNGIVDLAFWSASWGANVVSGDRIATIQGDGESSALITNGQNLIGLWNALLKTLAAAFIYGLFWCMASAIYLLLRKDVDETETDEIYVVDEKRTYNLPPLQSDENGIPQVQDPVPVPEVPEPADEYSDSDVDAS
jgi:hypothetical protein